MGHIAALNSYGNFKPTDQEEKLKIELFKQIDAELAIFSKVKDEEIPQLNKQIIENKIPFIELKREEE